MNKNFLIIFNLVISQAVSGQILQEIDRTDDPFCQMVKTVYSHDAMRFDVRLKEKRVFETDTMISSAKILVKKKGIDFSFLQIVPDEGEKELLFCNDSAWVVDHQSEKLECIGTTADDLTNNSMAAFFPFTAFTADTVISLVEPFWHLTGISKEHSVISLDIENHSDDVSDIRVEFMIGNSDHLLYKTIKEFLYLKADRVYEEQALNNYTFPEPAEIKIPEYYTIYGKDLALIKTRDKISENKPEPRANEVFLLNIELFDLSGKTFRLPEEGLIFFDLWYAGCVPCMKSAPVLEKVHEAYKDRLYFFSVNEIDHDTAKISLFLDKMGIAIPVLLGGKEKIGSKVTGSGGYPVFFLMDAESRKVLWSMEGYADNLEEIIREEINKNL